MVARLAVGRRCDHARSRPRPADRQPARPAGVAASGEGARRRPACRRDRRHRVQRRSTAPVSDDAALADFDARVRALVAIHADGVRPRNHDGELALLEAGGVALPVGVVAGDGGEAWVASPRRAYAAYAQAETDRHYPRAGRLAAPVFAAL